MDRLKNLKYPFDIYVSTQSSIDLKKLEIKLKKELPAVKKIVIKILPNRGMDLGPFIISFGKELLNYDIVGHFHTKKAYILIVVRNGTYISWIHSWGLKKMVQSI